MNRQNINTDRRECLEVFSEIISNFTDEEFDDFFDAMKRIRTEKLYFTYGDITVYNDYVVIERNNSKYAIETRYAYLELERLRKNEILKNYINETVKVTGVAGNVKMYSNTALFCLSPCIINGKDIGHTWTRYAPDFKNVRYGSVISFYSEIKRYGDFNSKSGVNWQEVTYVRMKDGDNSPLYEIPLNSVGIQYAKEYLKKYPSPEEDVMDAYNREIGIDPSKIPLEGSADAYSLKHYRFKEYISDDIRLRIFYNTFDHELVINSKYAIIPDKETQDKIDKLLLYEWMAKLEPWEFWDYTRSSS